MFQDGNQDPREDSLLVTVPYMLQVLEWSGICRHPNFMWSMMISLRLFTAPMQTHHHLNYGNKCICLIDQLLTGIMSHLSYQMNGYHQQRDTW